MRARDNPLAMGRVHATAIARELLPPGCPIAAESLESLFRRHQGNIRACLRELYDLYALDA